MIRLEQVRDALALASGQLGLSIPLGALPDPLAPPFALSADYHSPSNSDISGPVLTNPSGQIGLGWSLTIAMIEAVLPVGGVLANPRYRLFGPNGPTELLLLGTEPSGAERYGTATGDCWIVRFHRASDLWEVTDEAGVVQRFGAVGGLRDAVDTIVGWSGWSGASIRGLGQAAVAIRWRLAEIVDTWQNTIALTWQQDTALIGTGRAPCTRASRLIEVTGPLGGKLTLTYAAKDSAEYQPAHTSPPAPNAWQDAYDSQYLTQITAIAPGGATTGTTVLSSTLMGTAPAVKRLLTAVSSQPAAGIPPPGALFAYQTASPAAADYGRLTEVTVPEGGVAQISWTRLTPALSARNIEISPPAGLPAPTLSFGDDFVIALFRAVNNSTAAARAYVWEGRWIPVDVLGPTALLATNAVSQVACADLSFAVQLNANLYPFMRNPRQAGAWTGASQPIAVSLAAGEGSLLAAADGAAAILGQVGLKLTAATFDGATWNAVAPLALTGAGSQPVSALAATPQRIVAAVTDAANTQYGLTLTVLAFDVNQTWGSSMVALPRPTPTIDGLTLQLTPGFAVIRTTGPSGTLRRVVFDLVDFSKPNAPVVTRLSSLLIDQQALLPTAALFAAGVTIGQQTWRYDGNSWGLANLGSNVPTGAGALLAVSAGADLVVRTFAAASGGGNVFDAVTYDPNTAQWTSTLNCSATGDLTARAAQGSGDDTGFVLVPHPTGQGSGAATNALWRRQPDGSWRDCFDIPDPITAPDLASLQVVAGRYLTYQTAGTAVAYALNGSGVLAASRMALSGAVLMPSGSATVFATYTGTAGPTATVSLHRVTDDGAEGLASVPAVEALALLPGAVNVPTSGYPAVTHMPTYELASAIGDVEGSTAGFNRVTLAQTDAGGNGAGTIRHELFNGLTGDEAAALPSALQPAYPVDPNSNAASYVRLLGGLSYRTTIAYTDPAGTARLDVNTLAWAVGERAFATFAAMAGHPTGFYAQIRTTSDSRDGVTVTSALTYNANGLPASLTATRFDGAGALQTVVTSRSYLPDHYSGAPENLLVPVIRTTTVVNGSVTADEVETWQAWGPGGCWAPVGRFIAAVANAADFDAWAGGTTPTGWLMTETVIDRNVQGLTTAANGLAGAGIDIRDRTGAQLVARFAACAPGEADYFGCEPYEVSTSWSYIGGSLSTQLSTAQCHTGTQSLRIDPSSSASPAGPAAVFLNATTDRSFQFGCWMLNPSNFIADSNAARWTLQVSVAATGVAVGAPVILGFPATNGLWSYVTAVVDLGAIRVAGGIAAGTALNVTVRAADTRPTSVASYVDELRFMPLDSVFSGQVFESATGLISAILGDSGATNRIVRTGALSIAAIVGPADTNVKMVMATGYARAGGASFTPAQPNQILRCKSASFGIYHDFDPTDTGGWNLPTGWTITNRALQFSGQSTDPVGSRAELSNFVQSDYAVRVRVLGAQSQGSTVSIGTGDLFVSWIPGSTPGQGSWSLRQLAGSTLTILASAPGAFGEEWLFAVVDGVLLFYVDGAQLLGWKLGFTPQGKLQLAANASTAFEQLVVSVDPELFVEFIDGAGQSMLGMALIDQETVQVEGQLYDTFGRLSVTCNPVVNPVVTATVPNLPAPAPTQTQGALTTYLPAKSGGGQMTLADYLTPSISGAPYSQTVFEASPYARPTEIGEPGADYAVGSGHSTTIAYLANQVGDWMASVITDQAAPGRAAGSYAITRVTDPNGLITETATNSGGQVIARATRTSVTSAPIALESYLYDTGGRQIEIRTPNFYSPPAGTAATLWRRTASYDFLGRLTATMDADAGQDLFLSDSQSRPRFSMSAADAALAPPVIRYVKRDQLGRVTERGSVAKTGLAWAGLAAHIDDQTWPSATDGAIWTHRYSYDRPPTLGPYDPQPANLVGRLAVLSINSGGQASPGAGDVETYSYTYDLVGNVIGNDVSVPAFDASTRRTLFEWDNQNRLTAITYPRALDGSGQPIGTGVTVTYFYDRVGRMAGIGNAPEGTEVLDPSLPNPGPMARYADYRYGPLGLPDQITYGLNSRGPIQRTFSFDNAGRPLAMGGDYLSQDLTYGSGGLGNTSDWAGRVTSNRVRYASTVGDPSAAITGDRTWQYRYDPRGWLNGAVASDYATNSALSAGVDQPISFDANGVLQSVPRGPVTEAYGYVADGASGRENSAPRRITAAASQAIDFSSGALPVGWTDGASNGGPSASAIVTTGDPDAPFFRLAGGGVGHQEFLRFEGALAEAGQYTLAVRWRSATGFAAQSGVVGWALILHTASGEDCRITLSDCAAGSTSWRDDTITVDMAAAVAAAGLQGQIVTASLELANGKRGPAGSAGATLDVKSLTLSGGTAPAQAVYDASGRMTVAPARGIASVTYGPAPGQPTVVNFSPGAQVKQAAWRREGNNRPVLGTTIYADNSATKTLYLRAPGGGLLATQTLNADGTSTSSQYLRDEQRVFGTLPPASGGGASGPVAYRLFDSLGSLRVVAAEGSSAGLIAQLDYDPFGQLVSAMGNSKDAIFAGHGLATDGLLDLNARLYDPKLRALLTTDAAQATNWAYGYAGGDPVNLVDPSGDFPTAALRAAIQRQPWRWGLFAASGLIQLGYWVHSTDFTAIRSNWKGTAADVGEVAASMLIGAGVRLAANCVVSPAQGLMTDAVHALIPRFVPVMSLALDIASPAYWAGMYGFVRTLSAYYMRGTLKQLSPAGLYNSTYHHAVSVVPGASIATLYRHFLAPAIWFPGTNNRFVRGTGSDGIGYGPLVRQPAGSPTQLFLLADGTYAFEEYMLASAYVPWFLQAGNADMRYDTNWAIWIARPFHYYWYGHRYGAAPHNGGAAGMVLEHRPLLGWTLFLRHSVHTPGLGGPAHIGSSTFINKNVRVAWWAYNAVPATLNMIAATRHLNLTELTGGGGDITNED